MTRKTFITPRILIAAALAAATPFAGASVAAAQAAIAPNMQVVDTAGNPVGIVTSVNGANVIVRTDKHEVQLPATAFTPNEGKLLFGMTRDQLNTTVDSELAAAEASIVAGAEVRGSDGSLAGHLEAIDSETVTLKLAAGGDLVKLPRDAVAGAASGPVLGVTTEELTQLAMQARAEAEATQPTQ